MTIFSCKQDDIQDVDFNSIQNQKEKINHFTIENLPDIEHALNKIGSNRTERFMTTTFGDLDLSDILQFVNVDGKETYSFRILNSSNTQSQIDFENLHLIKLPEDNGYLAYIIQWQPNPEWYVENSYIFNLENFDGFMNRYDLDYNLLDSREFENGIVINTQQDSNRDMDSGCDVLQYTVCVYDCDHCSIPTCYEVIEISCTSGGGGGGGDEGDFPDPIPGEEGGTGTHIPGGTGTGGTTGTGGYVPGGNGGAVVLPKPNSEILTFHGMTLTPEESLWANKKSNKEDVKIILDFLLENCQSGVVTEYTCEEAKDLAPFMLTVLMHKTKVGDKPLEEFTIKCDGLERMWELGTYGPILYPEIAGVLTSNNNILITDVMGEYGGVTKGLAEVGGNTYYFYPVDQGEPTEYYPDLINKYGHYFIPIEAYIHTHSIAINIPGDDGVTGGRDNGSDQNVARLFEMINHYIIGDGVLGQMTGASEEATLISSGSIEDMCPFVN